MPRTKARKREKKVSKAHEDGPEVSAAILAEINDVKVQWTGRRGILVSKRDELLSAIELCFNMAIMGLGPREDFLLSWDSEDEDDENEVPENAPSTVSPFDDTVSTSVISPGFESVTSSFAQSEALSVAVVRRSRSMTRHVVAKTPAPRSISATALGHVTASRTLRSSSQSRDRLAELAAPSTTSRSNMPPPSMRNRFCTPSTHTVPDGSRYNFITPKVMPNSSVSVLRRPRGGEMAFAMTGSPLMVASNNIGDEVCNVNLPLGDGRVLSILPTALRPRDLPPMNEDTMDQLCQLRNNLNMILQDCELGARH